MSNISISVLMLSITCELHSALLHQTCDWSSQTTRHASCGLQLGSHFKERLEPKWIRSTGIAPYKNGPIITMPPPSAVTQTIVVRRRCTKKTTTTHPIQPPLGPSYQSIAKGFGCYSPCNTCLKFHVEIAKSNSKKLLEKWVIHMFTDTP